MIDCQHHLKKKWLNQAVDKVLLVYPDDDVDEIRGFLSKKFDSDLSDKKCKIYNNYEKGNHRY